jgi:hypothetical protein
MPSRLADLRVGPPTTFPRLAAGVLYVGSETVATEADRLVFRGGTTLVGRADDHRSRWWLYDGGRLVDLLDEAAPYVVPVLSADGGTAVWRIEVDASQVGEATRAVTWELVAYDIPSRSTIGRTWLGGEVTCCDQGGMVLLAGVTNDGRVSLSGGPAGGLSIWRAGDPLVKVRVRATSYTGADAWPLGVSYVPASGSGERVRFARVDADGEVTDLGVVPETGLWSPDGRLVVDRVRSGSTGTTRVEVTVAVTGESVSLGLPPAPDWEVLAWEDESHVLTARVRTSDTGEPTYTAMIRCEAVSGTCERVSDSA